MKTSKRMAWVTRDRYGDRQCQLFVGTRPMDDLGEWFVRVGTAGIKACRPTSCHITPTMAALLTGGKMKAGDIVSVSVQTTKRGLTVPFVEPQYSKKRPRPATVAKRLLRVMRTA